MSDVIEAPRVAVDIEIEAHAAGGEHVALTTMSDAADRLIEKLPGAAIGILKNNYRVTATVHAAGLQLAIILVRRAALDAGFPEWPLVRVRADMRS